MTRHIWRLLALVLLGILPAYPLHAQQGSSAGLPDTTPPSLTLVLAVDDSSTMRNTNTARSISGLQASTGRPASDPNDIRGLAMRYLIDVLAADTQQLHRIAILNFGAGNVTNDNWLTGNSANRFVTIGGPACEGQVTTACNPAPEANRNTLLQALQTRPVPLNGPGLVGDALLEAANALRSAQTSTSKPAIVLVTDDVPMQGLFNASNPNPWFPGSRDGWVTYTENLEQALALRTSEYSGFCDSPRNTLPVITLALGTAAWVDADGTLRPGGDGDYYANLAALTGAFGGDASGDPLYYPIDTRLELNALALFQQMTAAVEDLLGQMRCTYPIASEQVGTSATLTFQVSAVFDQLQIGIRRAADAQNVRIQRADLQPVNGDRAYVTAERGLGGEIYVFQREAHPQGWVGSWQLTLPVGAEVVVQASVDFASIALDLAVDPQREFPSGTTISLPLRVTAAGSELNSADTGLIERIVGRLQERSDLTIGFQPSSGGFVGRVDSTALDTGRYSLALDILLAETVGSIPTLYQNVSIAGNATIIVRGDAAIDRFNIQPAAGDAWACREDRGDGGVVPLQVPFNASEAAEYEGLGLYLLLDVIYPQPTPLFAQAAPQPTPLARLRWQPQGGLLFAGDVPCAALQTNPQRNLSPQATQAMLIRAVLPDGRILDEVEHGFILLPTETSVPTATPTASPTATVTPTPSATRTPTQTPTPAPAVPTLPPASLLDEPARIVGSVPPWLQWALMIGVGLALLVWAWGLFRRVLLPLTFVQVRYGERGRWQPVRPFPRGLAPAWRERLTTGDGAQVVLELQSVRGRSLAVRALVEALMFSEEGSDTEDVIYLDTTRRTDAKKMRITLDGEVIDLRNALGRGS